MQWNKLDYAMSRAGAGSGDDVTSVSAEPTMLDVLQGFVHELRLAGLPVSMTENLDAMRAVEHVPLEDRDAFKTALGATLVKHHGHHKVFDTVFEVYFSMFSPGVDDRGEGAFDERLAREEYEGRLKVLKEMIEAEIRRRLVADRGVEAMARTLRKPLPEDVDFMHASREEMQQLQKAIYPLTRALAARLAQRCKRRNRGHLDFPNTVRHSLSYGGVPAELKFKHPKPSKPEIMVIADISGSVASFARFTLQFVYAMASEFSKVRSWVFIDGIDEVTRFFQEADEIGEAIHRVNTEADVIWVDGHSDYGHALELYYDRHHLEVTHKTSIMLLGDARNNYHASQAWVVQELNKRARHVYFLNPEPRGYWDTGDSIVSEYGKFCDGVYECRNLRQLERFVEEVAEA